ncbi:hypothetical protein Tco_1216678 [Tanacetum coccineum]
MDDYSRFTCVKFLRSKDETPEFVINFLKQMQNSVPRTLQQNNISKDVIVHIVEASHSTNDDILKSTHVSRAASLLVALSKPTKEAKI